jgi:hypothetical protein
MKSKTINLGWKRLWLISTATVFLYTFLSEYFGDSYSAYLPKIINELIFFIYDIFCSPFVNSLWSIWDDLPALFIAFFWGLSAAFLFGITILTIWFLVKWIIDGFKA